MAPVKQDWEHLLEELKTERERLAVKASLAKAEIRDEWQQLEQKWEHLRARNAQVKQSVGKTGEAVWADLKKAGEDLREGYRRLKSLLS